MISVEVMTDTLFRYRPVLVEPLDSHAAVALIVDTARSTQDPDIVFIERAAHEGDPWSGHVAFPGGRCESEDDGPSATAVSETREEIGIDLSVGHLLGRLGRHGGALRGGGRVHAHRRRGTCGDIRCGRGRVRHQHRDLSLIHI